MLDKVLNQIYHSRHGVVYRNRRYWPVLEVFNRAGLISGFNRVMSYQLVSMTYRGDRFARKVLRV
jgi:hypothetical protein